MKYRIKMKLKKILEEKGMSQKELSEKTNIRESTISDIVRENKTVINYEHLSKISEALEIQNISEIIDFEKNDKQNKG